MKIKERIYPYPVVKEETADYKDYKQATFDFTIDAREIGNGEFKLNLEILPKSITYKLLPGEDNPNIKYGFQIDSLMNKYRKFISSDSPKLEFILDGANFIGRVEVNAYIYTTERIEVNLDDSTDGNEAFYNGIVEFPKGAIIAVARPTRQLIIKSDGVSRENPVRIVRDDSVFGISYDINNTNIEVRLNKENHEIYSRYAKDPLMKQFVTNAIVVPAVSKAIWALAEGQIDQENSEWANFFVERLNEEQIDLADIGESVSLEEATEVLLNNPTTKMFKKLQEYGENGIRG
ncbi:hypothetical protein [Weissella cibaria]|uniref:hypothetical protein n=1 Tax=Weissella cibaria TaxID=137591 RepID=UPI003D36BC13